MNEPMHDLLDAALERNANTFSRSTSFAAAHRSGVLRSIRRRRIAATAVTGVAAAALIGAAGYGVAALSGAPSEAPPAAPATGVVHTSIDTDLIPFAMDNMPYMPGETDRIYVFYVTTGATDMIPFPSSGIWYPGIPDVPSDAILVALNGDASGYGLTAPGTTLTNLEVWPGATGEGMNLEHPFDVVGDVSSQSRWGLHFYLVDGSIVSVEEGQSRTDAVEVTAMIGSEATSITPAAPMTTDIVPLMTDSSDGHYFYLTFGAKDKVPFAGRGVMPPNAPDVPSDAILVRVQGDGGGYDLTAPGALETDGYFGVFDADGGMGDAEAPTFDVIGDVTSTTRWGIHFYLVDGHLVTEAEGKARADAVEVTAMLGSEAAASDVATSIRTTLVPVPLDDAFSTDGENSRTYAFYASLGATDTIPFPGGRLLYSGAPLVPSDAVILVLAGGVDGFDLAHADLTGDRCGICIFEWTEDGQNPSIAWDVIGDVTDHTIWGIRYYLVNGEVVREIDGRGNPDAIEVTAMFLPSTFTGNP